VPAPAAVESGGDPGQRSTPRPAAGTPVRRARGPRRGPDPALEDRVCRWVERRDPEPGVRPAAPGDQPTGPALGAALNGRALGCRVVLDVLVLEPRSTRLDTDGAVEPLRRALAALSGRPGPRHAAIDLSAVAVVSARALAALADPAAGLSRAGGALRLCHVRPAVLAAVRQARLDRLVGVYPTVDEAVVARWG
jgi:anti-anti-sigma factor